LQADESLLDLHGFSPLALADRYRRSAVIRVFLDVHSAETKPLPLLSQNDTEPGGSFSSQLSWTPSSSFVVSAAPALDMASSSSAHSVSLSVPPSSSSSVQTFLSASSSVSSLSSGGRLSRGKPLSERVMFDEYESKGSLHFSFFTVLSFSLLSLSFQLSALTYLIALSPDDDDFEVSDFEENDADDEKMTGSASPLIITTSLSVY